MIVNTPPPDRFRRTRIISWILILVALAGWFLVPHGKFCLAHGLSVPLGIIGVILMARGRSRWYRTLSLLVIAAGLAIVAADGSSARTTALDILGTTVLCAGAALFVGTAVGIVLPWRWLPKVARWGAYCGALLCLLDAILFRQTSFDVIFGILAAITAFLFLVGFCGEKRWLRLRPVSWAAWIFAPLSILTALWLGVYVLANISWKSESMPGIPAPYQATPEEEADYTALVTLIPKESNSQRISDPDIKALVDAVSLMPQDFMSTSQWADVAAGLEKAEPGLNKLWDFLATHRPRTSRFDPKTPAISFLAIRIGAQIEALAIRRLCETGSPEQALPRLRRFVAGASHFARINHTIVNASIGNAIASMVVDKVHDNARYLPNSGLEQLCADLSGVLNSVSRPEEGIRAEFFQIERTLDDIRAQFQENSKTYTTLLGAESLEEVFSELKSVLSSRLEKRTWYWPFFDKDDTRRLIASIYNQIPSSAPYVAQAVGLKLADEEIEKIVVNWHWWEPRNPGGRGLIAIATPSILRFYSRAAFTRWLVAGTQFQLMRVKGIESTDLLLNPLTGKPFEPAPDLTLDIKTGLTDRAAEQLESCVATDSLVLPNPFQTKQAQNQ